MMPSLLELKVQEGGWTGAVRFLVNFYNANKEGAPEPATKEDLHAELQALADRIVARIPEYVRDMEDPYKGLEDQTESQVDKVVGNDAEQQAILAAMGL